MDERAQLRRWAESGDEQLVRHVDQCAQKALFTPDYDDWVMTRLPRVIALPWRVADLEMEILNGGYAQFFWNGGGDYAPFVVDDFVAMGADRYAAVHRAALDRYLPVASAFRSASDQSAALEVEGFGPDDDAYMAVYNDEGPAFELVRRWLAERVDEVADAIAARSPHR